MFKRVLIFILLIVESFLFPLLSSPVYADDCSDFTFDPSNLKQDMGDTLKITATSTSLPGGNSKYYMDYIDPHGAQAPFVRGLTLNGQGKTTGEFKLSGSLWEPGKYTVNFGPDSDLLKTFCTSTFTINEVPSQSGCTITANGTNYPDTSVGIDIENINPGKYDIKIVDQSGSEQRKFTNDLNKNGNNLALGTFPAGTYNILVKNTGGYIQLQCPGTPFTVLSRGAPPPSATPHCDVQGDGQPSKTISSKAFVVVSCQNLDPTAEYKFVASTSNPTNAKSLTGTSNGAGSLPYNLGLLAEDTYNYQVIKTSTSGVAFSDTFSVGPAPSATPCNDPAKCTSGGGNQLVGCTDTNNGISTAIGCIHTSPAGFVKDFLGFVIGISGGLAFLMMLLGAFQMLTSAGNPESVNAGRERLTSAIIGLLIVIFAVLLLQIIGADILRLGDFGK